MNSAANNIVNLNDSNIDLVDRTAHVMCQTGMQIVKGAYRSATIHKRLGAIVVEVAAADGTEIQRVFRTPLLARRFASACCNQP